MKQPFTNLISLSLDLPYVGVINHENPQKSIEDNLQDHLHTLRLSGLITP